MASKIRIGTLVFAALAVGYYLYYGITYQPDEFTGAMLGWVNWRMSLPIVALTIVPIVFAFSGEGIMSAFTGRNSAAFRDMPVGIATVRSVRQTGLTVNDQPQVRVELSVEGADGVRFDSHTKIIVPLTELALLRPGVVLPVRYQPGRTDKVEIDRSNDRNAMQQAVNESMIRRGLTSRRNLDIAASGVAARAVVQSLSVTGEIREGYTKVDLGLVVTRPDSSTFAARVQKFVPQGSIDHVQVGRIVQAHYLPGAEQDIVLALPLDA
ncbi:hypothetical protein [Nocardia stercoris]|uniref:Uncharacterized protein n=1 Tax=Nocardia stercoris TaxID=2483361 RepID=A0A3M2LDF5_9NOCA|nr:hypothetical protein [Nocardia stercoris]RMI33995.1 hypothetical protein EBN03_05945 [Nocardia stercoris]